MISKLLLLNIDGKNNDLPPYIIYETDVNQNISSLTKTLNEKLSVKLDIFYIEVNAQDAVGYNKLQDETIISELIYDIVIDKIYSVLGYCQRSPLDWGSKITADLEILRGDDGY